MMPLDVSDRAEIEARMRAYLTILSVPEEQALAWVREACEGASHAGQAFRALQARFEAEVRDKTPSIPDETGCAALWRLSAWLKAPPEALATIPLAPPLTRQSMASERKR